MTDLTQIRHAYRLAVATGDKTLIKWQMFAKLKEEIWPNVPFVDKIPVLIEPKRQLWSEMPDGTHGWLPNPNYLAEVDQRQQQINDYIEALQAQYPTARIILQAFNTSLGWWTVDEPDNPQWEGYVLRTVNVPKTYALRKLSGV